LPFIPPSPGILTGGAAPCPSAPWSGGGDVGAFGVGHRVSRAEPLPRAARSILFSFWQREQISLCMKLN